MGLFDTLYAPLKCPVVGIEKEVEIQFKWADPLLRTYRIGGQLELGPYGNIWIPEDYVCDQCIEHERAEREKKGKEIVFHAAFIHLDQGKFEEVVSEEEFTTRYVKEGKVALPEGEFLFINYFNFKEGKPAYLAESKAPL